MSEEELIAALRLQRIPNIGDISAKKLIAHCGGPKAIFSDKKHHLQKIEGIGPLMIQGLFQEAHLREAEREYGFIRKQNIRCSYFQDADYPAYLKHCPDSPILLFCKGEIALEGRKLISVVGTRSMTTYGMSFCEEFVAEIAPLDPVIISGFAYGVDICVHKAAMKYGLQTIACLAHGLNQFYPRNHQVYARGLEENGGFITEFWSTSKPDRENFLRRNRVIAGLSEATVLIESAEKGGGMVTADMAHGYNRDVFAVPGRVDDFYSAGCNKLIRQQKAHMLTSAADLIYLLGWDLSPRAGNGVQKQIFVDLDDTEQCIYSYLEENGRQMLDQIALACSLPVFMTSSTLLTMEMKGLIRPFPGKWFEAV